MALNKNRNAAAVVDHAEQHQRGRLLALVHPGRALDVLEVGRAEIELPQGVAVACLKAHRRRLAGEPLPVQAPVLEVTVDGGLLQHALRGQDKAVRRFEAIVFQQPDGLGRGEMAALFVGGADLDRGDQLAVVDQLRFG